MEKNKLIEWLDQNIAVCQAICQNDDLADDEKAVAGHRLYTFVEVKRYVEQYVSFSCLTVGSFFKCINGSNVCQKMAQNKYRVVNLADQKVYDVDKNFDVIVVEAIFKQKVT
jgi:hypothetical protein